MCRIWVSSLDSKTRNIWAPNLRNQTCDLPETVFRRFCPIVQGVKKKRLFPQANRLMGRSTWCYKVVPGPIWCPHIGEQLPHILVLRPPTYPPAAAQGSEATRCRRRRRRCPSGARRGWPTSATPTSAPRWCGTASRSPSSPRPRPARRFTSPSPSGRTASRRSPVSAPPLLHPIRSCPALLIRFDAIWLVIMWCCWILGFADSVPKFWLDPGLVWSCGSLMGILTVSGVILFRVLGLSALHGLSWAVTGGINLICCADWGGRSKCDA